MGWNYENSEALVMNINNVFIYNSEYISIRYKYIILIYSRYHKLFPLSQIHPYILIFMILYIYSIYLAIHHLNNAQFISHISPII